MNPDYQSYTLEELYDVRAKIDKELYPARYEYLLKEISVREHKLPKKPVTEDSEKPKRKRTNKEKIVSSTLILSAVGLCLYYEKIPGRHGGLTMSEDPYFFWGTLLFCAGLAINQLLTLESRKSEKGSSGT